MYVFCGLGEKKEYLTDGCSDWLHDKYEDDAEGTLAHLYTRRA